MKEYILVEGVNLYENIYDTDQLSVIRGSSFLYKEAIADISCKFSRQLTPLSTGASSGLFTVNDLGSLDVKKLENYLNDHAKYQHLIFIVECCTADNVLEARAHLQRQLRFSQLKGITYAPDCFSSEHPRISCVDELEGSRIAAGDLQFPIRANDKQESRQLSLSVYERWLHGRQKKQANDTYSFASDIQCLCSLSESSHNPTLPPEITRLNNKMAVFYADGNQFGKRERHFISQAIKNGGDGINELTQFDDNIQNQREEFRIATENWLSGLANHSGQVKLTPEQRTIRIKINSKYEKITLKEMALRMETLLWGGDEMTLVLPAWLGIAFVQRFFSNKWTLVDNENEPLTHAAGIVFCQSKTPISIVEKLARELADQVKERTKRQYDGWDYMVMESMDFPDNTQINDFLQSRYGHKLNISDRPAAALSPNDWDTLNQSLLMLLDERVLSRRKLYQIIDAIELEAGAQAGPAAEEKPTAQTESTQLDLKALFSAFKKPTPEEIAEEKYQEQVKELFSHTAINAANEPPNNKYQKPQIWHELMISITGKTLRQEHWSAQESAEYRLFEVLTPSEREKILDEDYGLPFIAKQLFGIRSLDKAEHRAWLWLHLAELWDYWLPMKSLHNNSANQNHGGVE